jgi:hypothetical protein
VALEVEAINLVRLGMFPPNLLFIFGRWGSDLRLLPDSL